MDHQFEFVTRENVKNLRRQLEDGAEPKRRATMLKILVEEENKLGFTREQLDKLDRHISRLAEIMARQVELTDGLRSNGHSTERAETILATLKDVMACYIAHRERLHSEA